MKVKSLIITFLLIVASSIGCFSQKLTYSDMVDAATQVRTMCPAMVDAETRLDDCQAVPNDNNLTIQYNYTMINFKIDGNTLTNTKTGLSINNLTEVQNIQTKNLTKNIKYASAMSLLRENNVVFIYMYYDKNHHFIFQCKITPTLYKSDDI